MPVADRLLAGAAGNPLALLEIPALLSDDQLAGRAPLESPLRPGMEIKRAFRMRVDRLPEETRRALLVAAASESPRADTILAGLAAIGIGADALDAAESAGLVQLEDGRLDFRHPLLRSTAYYAALAGERRAVHRALADGRARRQRRARLAPGLRERRPRRGGRRGRSRTRRWTRARRGAPGTAARDFARSAQLSPGDEERARRLLEAALEAAAVGSVDQALAHLDEAGARTRTPASRRRCGGGGRTCGSACRSTRTPTTRCVGEADARARRRPAARRGDVPRGVRRAHEHGRHGGADRDRGPLPRARRGPRPGPGAARRCS